MKIGILTCHCATDYREVLQCYSLQSYLKSVGHEVKVINNKPQQYDANLFTFFFFRNFLNIAEYVNGRKKEKALSRIMETHLHQTGKVLSCSQLSLVASPFDVILSGSDHVLNLSFLLLGEGKGKVTPTYFLGFSFNGKRVGYALSFDSVKYLKNAIKMASKYNNDFDVIMGREETRVDIFKANGREDAVVVFDQK